MKVYPEKRVDLILLQIMGGSSMVRAGVLYTSDPSSILGCPIRREKAGTSLLLNANQLNKAGGHRHGLLQLRECDVMVARYAWDVEAAFESHIFDWCFS